MNTPNSNNNDVEQRYLEAAVDETARRIVRPLSPDADVDEIIKRMHTQEQLFQTDLAKFTKLVNGRVAEMQQKARDTREAEIMDKYKGQITQVSGKYVPAGVSNEFKLDESVTAVGLKGSAAAMGKKLLRYAALPAAIGVGVATGSILAGVGAGMTARRLMDFRFTADDFDKLVTDTEKLEGDIKGKEAEVARLVASEKSYTQMYELAKKIHESKVAARGGTASVLVSGRDSLVATAAKSAAEAFKLNSITEQGRNEALKVAKKELREKGSQLEKNRKIIANVQQQLEEIREKGREVYNQAFGDQVKLLKEQKATMYPEEFEHEVATLRSQIGAFSKETGLQDLSYFMDETLGIEHRSAATTSPEYKEPVSAKEKAREAAISQRFFLEISGQKMDQGEIDAYIKVLRQKQPAFLTELNDGKVNLNTDVRVKVLQFLFQGKLPSGKEVLTAEKRVSFRKEHLASLLGYAIDVQKKGLTDLEDKLKDFAKKWGHTSFDDFDTNFEKFLANEAPPKIPEAQLTEAELKDLGGRLRTLTRVTVPENEVQEWAKLMRKQKVNTADLSAFLKNSGYQTIFSFFFQGIQKSKVVFDTQRLLKPQANDLALAFERTKLFVQKTPKIPQIQKVFEYFTMNDKYRGKSFQELDEVTFDTIQKELNKKKKSSRKIPLMGNKVA